MTDSKDSLPRPMLGQFRSLGHARQLLHAATVMRDVNTSVMRATGSILGADVSNTGDISAYALSVMADQEANDILIEDLTAIVAEMEEIEALAGE
jgi:glucuronate isomerase